MQESIKFTVIIPTRERANTLFYSLRTVVAQDYKDLTILVSDNFSQDNTRQVVDFFHDPRIKYINTEKRLSMTHNFEFALSHIKDGWVAFIGDDDGLLPEALNTVADVIRKTGCQAIMSNLCFYNWPGIPVNEGLLTVPLNKGIELRNARAWLSKVMRGQASYLELPITYTGGFINSQIIEKARSGEGLFYSSVNPDAYSTIALASVLDNYVMLKEPVAISGASTHSIGNSWMGVTKNDFFQKFLSEGIIPFDSRVRTKDWPKDWPKSPSLHLYECYLQSEHLHHDFLKIKMEDQLGLALSRSTPEWYDNLRKYCVEIAQQNKIDMVIVDRKEKEFRQGEFFRHWEEIISRGLKYLFMQGKEFGIHDVYEASIAIRAIFLFKTRYSNWLLTKTIRRIGKCLRVSKGGL